MRGWSSPLDYNDERGGFSRILFNCEFRIPLYKILGLEVFYDGGFIDLKDKSDSSDMITNFNWNIGWGLVFQSTLGPARIDFAFQEGIGKYTIQVSLLNMF